MIPSDENLLQLQDKLEQARLLSGYTMPWAKPQDFNEIVVILGSSRSGSSLLFQVLGESGCFWSPFGEETPIFRTSGLGWIESTKQSDVVSSILPTDALEQIRQAIFCELGQEERYGMGIKSAHLDQFARRLLWQWPEEEFNLEEMVQLILRTPDWANVIQRLGLEDDYYDLRGHHSNRRSPLALPEWFIEEPPYVVPTVRSIPSPEDLKQHPILLKTTSHAYRIPLLKTLFPSSRFRWIVLARNPAAGINGLMDGWLSNAFHSHNLLGVKELSIEGYTSVVPHGDMWWKFDLPPGWSDYAKAPLSEVCAFQWRSAYEHILAQIKSTRDPVLMVKHEDLVNPQLGPAEYAKIFEFAGVKPLQAPGNMTTRPIMASVEPAPARWKRRQDELLPLLAIPEIRSVAEALDYDLDLPQTLL